MDKYYVKFITQLGNVQSPAETMVTASSEQEAVELATEVVKSFLKLQPIQVQRIQNDTAQTQPVG